jgi:DNA polymerase III sliding clamp (beta) subunit (PCNA family)
MKIEVAKSDLEAALQVVSIGTSGTGSDLSTHFLFRHEPDDDGDRVSVLAYNGRLGASVPIVCQAEVNEDGPSSFTVEAWRLKDWLSAAADTALTLEFDDGVVKATGIRGSVKFRSLDPSTFPYWDESLTKAKKIVDIEASRLHRAFAHAKLFISDKDTVHPHLAVTEIKNGSLRATDQAALTLITISELAESKLRIHGKDLQHVLSYLALESSEKIEVLEHDRTLFLKRTDEGILSVGRPHNAFPAIKVDKDTDDMHWWIVSTVDLDSAVKQLAASAAKEDRRLTIDFDPEVSQVLLSMTSASGSTDVLQLDCPEHGSMDDAQEPLPDGGFAIEYPYIQRLLSQYKEKTLRFGLNPQKKGGWIRFRDDRDGDGFLTLLVWLQS